MGKLFGANESTVRYIESAEQCSREFVPRSSPESDKSNSCAARQRCGNKDSFELVGRGYALEEIWLLVGL